MEYYRHKKNAGVENRKYKLGYNWEFSALYSTHYRALCREKLEFCMLVLVI